MVTEYHSAPKSISDVARVTQKTVTTGKDDEEYVTVSEAVK
jgi:hypothetical protein